jgi:hypothetical protein
MLPQPASPGVPNDSPNMSATLPHPETRSSRTHQ